MTDETIVAIYDTPAHAELAAADLKAAGVAASAISVHAKATTGTIAATAMAAPREEGFWASLFGGSPDHDTSVYDRSVDSGSTVVTVKAAEAHVTEIMEILESHQPIDIEERAATYGSGTENAGTTATGGTMAGGAMAGGTMAGGTMAGGTMAGGTMAGGAMAPGITTRAGMTGASYSGDSIEQGGTIQLAEEQLSVGKRVVNRGGTRVRRYVVETPVEQSVSLHEEKVTLDRRPVADSRPVTDADFTDRTIELTETAEEAVVSKTARVVEEVALGKTATDRVETVRDTVRKQEVEIEKIPGTTTTGATTVDPRAPKV